MLIPSLKKTKSGYAFSLPPPRGFFSNFLLMISGAFSFTLATMTLTSWIFDRSTIPDFMISTTIIVTLTFLYTLLDRKLAQKKGVHIRFFISSNTWHYCVLRNKNIIEENPLTSDRLSIAIMKLPGSAGRIIVPTYVLLFRADFVDEGYRAKTSEGDGYALMHFTNQKKLLEHVKRFCETLGLATPKSCSE